MKKIDKLKVAVFSEWSYDPPCGGVELLYITWADTYNEISWPVGEIQSNISVMLDSDEEDELQAAVDAVGRTRKSIEAFSWDNGGVGGGCEFVASGKEIVDKIEELCDDKFEDDFYYDEEYYADWEEEDIDEEELQHKKNIEVLEAAKEDPENYDKVVELLDLVTDLIENRNCGMM